MLTFSSDIVLCLCFVKRGPHRNGHTGRARQTKSLGLYERRGPGAGSGSESGDKGDGSWRQREQDPMDGDGEGADDGGVVDGVSWTRIHNRKDQTALSGRAQSPHSGYLISVHFATFSQDTAHLFLPTSSHTWMAIASTAF